MIGDGKRRREKAVEKFHEALVRLGERAFEVSQGQAMCSRLGEFEQELDEALQAFKFLARPDQDREHALLSGALLFLQTASLLTDGGEMVDVMLEAQLRNAAMGESERS